MRRNWDEFSWESWSYRDCVSREWHIEELLQQLDWDCPEDVPISAEFRCNGINGFRMATKWVGMQGVHMNDQEWSWANLASMCEYTIDGINWHPCKKNVKV